MPRSCVAAKTPITYLASYKATDDSCLCRTPDSRRLSLRESGNFWGP